MLQLQQVFAFLSAAILFAQRIYPAHVAETYVINADNTGPARMWTTGRAGAGAAAAFKLTT